MIHVFFSSARMILSECHESPTEGALLDCTCVSGDGRPPLFHPFNPPIHPTRIPSSWYSVHPMSSIHPSWSAPRPVAIRATFSPGVTARSMFSPSSDAPISPRPPIAHPPPMSCTPGKDQLIAYLPPIPLSIFCCESGAAFSSLMSHGLRIRNGNEAARRNSVQDRSHKLEVTTPLMKLQQIEFLRKNPKFWSPIHCT